MNTSNYENEKNPSISSMQNGEKSTAILHADSVNIFGKDKERVESDNSELMHLYEELGIGVCVKELKGTDLEPLDCMKKLRKSLDFMGVGGEKWVKDAQMRKAFENMLRRTKTMGNEVRFLLINPACESYNRLYQLRGESVPYASYEYYEGLTDRFDNLKVHLYNDMPSLRMQFVDDSYLAIARYYIDEESHEEADGGWKTPHLIIHSEQRTYGQSEVKYKGSLYDSFHRLYNFIWLHSDDIKTWSASGKIFNK